MKPTKKRRPPWQAPFLDALRSSGNVRLAAKAVAISRKTVYATKARDIAFADDWEDALDEATDLLEEEAWRRAKDGVRRPVFQNGKRVGVVREYSDTLLIFLLKGLRPEKYRDNFDLAKAVAQISGAKSNPQSADGHPA